MTSSPLNVACIWGANGISGSAMVRVLVEQSRREWKRILCVSRRPSQFDFDDDRIYFLTLDLLQMNVDDVIKELLKAGGEMITHVFYYLYTDKPNPIDSNKELFRKVLDITVRIVQKPIRCFVLQTGYKYYGNDKCGEFLAQRPYVEEASRHSGENFYFDQEDLLKEYAEKYQWKSIITRPNIIIGVTRGNAMNLALTLALYAWIQKEKGQPLIYPGNISSWNSLVDHSDALNNARFQLWASTNEKIPSETFNIHNGDSMTFANLWTKMEKYFGFDHQESNDQKLDEKRILQVPLSEYMPANEDVWKRLVKCHQLDEDSFQYGTWSFADLIFARTFDDHGDLSKARRYGWKNTVDTCESYLQCFDQLKKMNIIPFG